MNTTTWLAIGLGGIAGALAALAGATRPSVPPPLPPVAAVPTDRDPGPTAAATAPEATPTRSVETKPRGGRNDAGSEAEPGADASSSAAPALPTVPAVGSKEELARAEISCQEKRDASACRTAALAYEQGLVVPADPAKGRLFRRIELTFLVKQCEGQVPSACAELAGRYQRGDGVPRSERNAEALRARVKELCASRGGAGCP
jgi:hypothetical protein